MKNKADKVKVMRTAMSRIVELQQQLAMAQKHIHEQSKIINEFKSEKQSGASSSCGRRKNTTVIKRVHPALKVCSRDPELCGNGCALKNETGDA